MAREKFQLSKEDSGLRLKTANADAQYMFTHKSTREILTLVMSLPNGVISHSKKIENAVDTSSNVGIINTGEDSVKVTNLARSSFNHCLDYYSVHFGALAKAFGACAKVTSRYPGWSFNNNSKLQEKYIKVYKNLFGEDTNPKIDSIHAGLECGVIKNALPDMDIISIGPTMFDVHTPKERLSLESFDRFMKILYEFIK